jgi:hypothetical protein
LRGGIFQIGSASFYVPKHEYARSAVKRHS